MTEPAALLDELTHLKARTRSDRHAYVAPLFLFGVLVLLAPLWVDEDPRRFEVGEVRFGTPPQLTWLVVVIGGYLAIGLVGVLAISVGFPLVESFAYRVGRSPYAAPSFTVPVAAVAVLALGGVLWLQPKVGSRAAVAAMVFGFVALAMLDLWFAPVRPYAPLVTIALGLVSLAWLERSRVLGVISGLFAAAALLANVSTTAFTTTLPGLVLLSGGAFAAWHERRARA